MIKNILIFILCMIILSVSACNENNDNQTNDVKIEDMEDNSLEKRIQDTKEQFLGPDLPETNVYINEECGYKFEFPESWTGSYFIDDEFPECAVVRFYGKSIRGTVLEKTFSEDYDYGLRMFLILSEEAVNNGTYDGVTLIGQARGVNYYFATTTDVSLAPIFGDGKFWFDESESEQQLMKKDRQKVKEMMEFYNYESRDDLAKAFMEI